MKAAAHSEGKFGRERQHALHGRGIKGQRRALVLHRTPLLMTGCAENAAKFMPNRVNFLPEFPSKPPEHAKPYLQS